MSQQKPKTKKPQTKKAQRQAKRRANKKKYNWQRLKLEFLASPTKTLAEFAEEKGLSISAVKRHASQDKWTQEKTELVPLAMKAAREKVINDLSVEAERRLKEWLVMTDQLKALSLTTLLEKGTSMTVREAIRAIQTVVSVEAKILGLDRGGDNKEDGAESGPAVQVNIGIQQTQIIRDEILSKLDRIAAGGAKKEIPVEPDTGATDSA